MSSVFKATSEIVQEMCDDFKDTTGITLTPSEIDNPIVAKFYGVAGAMSSFYSELQRKVNDIFPATASDSALLKHLASRSLSSRIQAQKSQGKILFTGTSGTVIPTGTQLKRTSDGAIVQTIESGTIVSGGASIWCESVSAGSDQNLDSTGNPFSLVTSITGVDSSLSNTTNFLNGRDIETSDEMRARIQEHDQDDNTGGNATAYETWAKEASSEVVTAKAIRLARGADTIDIYITSGTTDIQSTVQADGIVSRLPSATLISTVQIYVASLNPVTDDVLVKAPIEISKSVTFNYSLYTESTSSRAYCDGVILKIIKAYLYEARPGDVLTPSAIERLVDQSVGDYIKERKCSNLGTSTTYYTVPNINILTPGTITISSL
jgi:uncharacterized phage protein gp47/JayE